MKQIDIAVVFYFYFTTDLIIQLTKDKKKVTLNEIYTQKHTQFMLNEKSAPCRVLLS